MNNQQQHQHHRRISVSVREGPRVEARTGKPLQEAIQDVFSCCSTESPCHHRKSLADRILNSDSFMNIAGTLKFAREGIVQVEPRESQGGPEGESYSFGNVATAGDEEDSLDDFQRCVRCLKSDFKTFAATSFERLIKENVGRAMSEVWPCLERELKKTADTAGSTTGTQQLDPFPESFHEPASRKFPLAVIELYRRKNVEGAKKVIDLVFSLIPSKNKEVSWYWVECMEKLLEVSNSNNIQKDIYPKIAELAGGGKSASVNGKVGACRLLRKLAKRFNSEVIEKKVFPMMDGLAKDSHAEVRAAAASSLPQMIHRLQNKGEALRLINLIKEDSDQGTRAGLTSTIVKSVALLNPRDERNKEYLGSVMQTIKGLVKDAYSRGNIELLVNYSEYMGHVCVAFTAANIMKPRDVLWYLDAFLQLSKYDAKLTSEELYTDESEQEELEMPTGFANFRANMEFTRRHSIVEALISTKNATLADRAASLAALNTSRAIAVLRENAGSRKMSIPYGGAIPPSVCVRAFGPELERAHECRTNAAKQFYEFMMFAKPIVGFRHGLHPLVTDLMHDPIPEVRAAMAEKIFPIMEHLGPEAGVLHGELVYGLSDDDLDVIEALVPNLSRILKCLVNAKVLSAERVTPKLVEIGGAILFCEERLNQTTYYKVHQNMLEQFIILPFRLPGDYVFNNFVPSLFHRLRHMRVLPCRMAAANAIVIFLRHCRRSAQREEIRRRIKTDDPIGNVRRKVMELLPELKEMAPDEKGTKKLQDTLVHVRKSEVDRDVKAKLEEIAGKLDMKLVLEGSEKGKKKIKRKSLTGKNPPSKPPQDPEDAMKEMEEDYIESMESKLVGSSPQNFTEKRKSFYGSNRRKSVDQTKSSSKVNGQMQSSQSGLKK